MSFVATLRMYGSVAEIVPLKAKNTADAAREAYARCFCKTASITIPEDYDGSLTAHQKLLDGVTDQFLYGFLENLNREKWSDTGALQTVITAVPNKISIFDIVGVYPCDNETFYKDWVRFITEKAQTLQNTEKQTEIAELERELKDKQSKLDALRRK